MQYHKLLNPSNTGQPYTSFNSFDLSYSTSNRGMEATSQDVLINGGNVRITDLATGAGNPSLFVVADEDGDLSTVSSTSVGTDDQTIDLFNFNTASDELELSIEDDNQATQTVNLSVLRDHDWYVEGNTYQPNSITDNIYTEGNVTIGRNQLNSDRALTVYSENANNVDGFTSIKTRSGYAKSK